MQLKVLVAAVSAIGLLGAAEAPKPAAAVVPTGYLGPDDIDTYQILPPAPVAGTTRYEADRTVFLQTRKHEGTPRWDMAKGDDPSFALVGKGMSCALGAELTRENAPKTMAFFARVGLDASRTTNKPKDIYKRQRPYLIDEGNICLNKSDALARSPDYPSGHNTWGWTVGLILAEIAPDRATPIMARARAFGESRLVCGVHNMSAVHMGWANGSIMVAALHGKDEFKKDLEAVKKEVAAVRKAGPAPDPARCAAEAELVAKSVY